MYNAGVLNLCLIDKHAQISFFISQAIILTALCSDNGFVGTTRNPIIDAILSILYLILHVHVHVYYLGTMYM